MELNRYFQSCPKWTSTEIQERSEQLAHRAVQVWPYFGGKHDSKPVITPRTATGKTPTVLTLIDQRIPVKTWSEVLTLTLQTIADLSPEGFEQLASEYPRVINDKPSQMKRGTQLGNGVYVELNMSANRVVLVCQRAVALAELAPDMWQVEVRESQIDPTPDLA